MLEIKNISKKYQTGDFVQVALDNVSLKFTKNEFIAILGQSGSGKTTLLNIIGGLDHYDKGDLIINNVSTKKFKDKDWDAYRNNCIGFVFQNYNLINHISVLKNIEMCLTLSNVKPSVRKEKALKALERVGLLEHAHKKPNQLSGGQMQRVSIARALVNDPDIILADEPTGALDSKTSVQIMELIKEISKDKLVIMVTHNPELAKEYATRIIELKDGVVLNDNSKSNDKKKGHETYKLKYTKMSFLTALSLSFTNILTKKGRTFLTAFASSIGIIGIALILSLSNGFDRQIDIFEQNTLSNLPIIISQESMNVDQDTINKIEKKQKLEDYPKEKQVIVEKEDIFKTVTHKNKLTEEYIDYIEDMDSKYVSGISYYRTMAINFVNKINDEYKPIQNLNSISEIPFKLDTKEESVIEEKYDILEGKEATEKDELLLFVDNKNQVSKEILEAFNIDVSKNKIDFSNIIGSEIKVVMNNDYYLKIGQIYTINQDFENMYNSKNSLTLKIVGIARLKEEFPSYVSMSSIGYTEKLMNYLVEKNKNSNIIIDQSKSEYNVLTGEKLAADNNIMTNSLTKQGMISYLGGSSIPFNISIYPKDFDSKDYIIDYLDKHNKDLTKENQIIYTDQAEILSQLSGNIMNAITIVLISFSAISLVVSCIMIGIITYISVLERTKEIGILRAIGARKKDITRVFNAETFIIGLLSGLLGIGVTLLLLIPTNILLYDLTELKNVAILNPFHAIILIITSLLLTLVGGSIPAKIASKKDPVEALRTE